MAGALEDYRVLDVGINVLGPQAASLMADLGADVVKVELPGLGDQSRWIPLSPTDRRAAYFTACNRGKQSMTLDLRKSRGCEVLLDMAGSFDVMISNFRAGTMDGWGLGYEDVKARNSRLVYAVGSVFGPNGPDASREGADLTGQAAGGLISTMGADGDRYGPVGAVIADHIGAQNMCNAVLAALLARHRTGMGQRIDVSLLGGQIYAQAGEYTSYFMSGMLPGRANFGHPLLQAAYGVFPTADGHIAIVGVRGSQRPGFYAAIERPDLAENPLFRAAVYTREVRNELFRILREVFVKRTTAAWVARLEHHDQRFAAVNSYADVVKDANAWENGYLRTQELADGTVATFVGSPIQMSGTAVELDLEVPELGQHTEEILIELGYTWHDILALQNEGVI
jgi:formyl-CoA transferase